MAQVLRQGTLGKVHGCAGRFYRRFGVSGGYVVRYVWFYVWSAGPMVIIMRSSPVKIPPPEACSRAITLGLAAEM